MRLFDRFRGLRQYPELMTDSQTPYMLGRLVGAGEMAAHMLADSTDPNAVRVSEVLGGITAYFLEDMPATVSYYRTAAPPSDVPLSEAPTTIKPPRES